MAAVWAVVVQVMMTGGLHEDGLADTVDGMFGGRDAARRLEIMRDSRIGSYGALGLILLVGMRVGALCGLSLGWVVPVLVGAGVMSRLGMVVFLRCLPPARMDGLAAGLLRVRWLGAIFGSGMVMVAVLPLGVVLAMAGGAAVVVAGMRRWALARIGGHTGDVCGAVAMVVEGVCLSLFYAVWDAN